MQKSKTSPPLAGQIKIQKEEELKQQIEELTNNWKRALADYQNLEKRVANEKQEFIQFANANLIKRLLTVLHILEKAQLNLSDKGLELAISEFKKILKVEGVEGIEVRSGDIFSPNNMECVEVTHGDEENEGKVAEVVFKGYQLNRKLLIPAKVKVYKKEIK